MARDVDAATLSDGSITNPVEGHFRYVRADDKFQEYVAGIWTDKVLSLAGGGLGATNAGAARTALGLGTIATQDANNIAITGGTLANLGSLGVNGNITMVGALIAGSGAVQITDATGKIQALSSTYLANLSGINLTNLNASNLGSGTVPLARLGSGGTPSVNTFLRGDNTWATAMAYRHQQQINTSITLTSAGVANYDIGLAGFTTVGKMFFVPAYQGGSLTAKWTFPNASTLRFSTTAVAGGVPQTLEVGGMVLELM
jgi:hypothetical protein